MNRTGTGLEPPRTGTAHEPLKIRFRFGSHEPEPPNRRFRPGTGTGPARDQVYFKAVLVPSEESAKQIDDNSCGVFCLSFLDINVGAINAIMPHLTTIRANLMTTSSSFSSRRNSCSSRSACLFSPNRRVNNYRSNGL